MAGVRTAIRVEDAAVKAAFERLIALAGDPRAALADIGEGLLGTTKDRFREERAPDGSLWAPLSPEYAARKLRQRGKPKILQLRGHLFATLVYQVFPGHVAVGTNRIYGAVHQFGFPAKGIPARPYLGITEEDQVDAVAILEDHIQRALGGAGAAQP